MGSSVRVLRRGGSSTAACAEKSRVVVARAVVGNVCRIAVDPSDFRANCDIRDVMMSC